MTTLTKTKMKPFLVLSLFILFNFCSTPAKENESTEEEDVLTYMELYEMVVQGTGTRVEWHGEALDQSAVNMLTIFKEGKCGEKECGDAVFIENVSDNMIDFIVQAPFQIDDVTSELATRYSIEGNTKISIGCSHLCYDGESYLFERRIVGAKEITEADQTPLIDLNP